MCRAIDCQRKLKRDQMREYVAKVRALGGADPSAKSRDASRVEIACARCGRVSKVQKRSSGVFCSRDCARAATLDKVRPRKTDELVHAPHLRDTRGRHVFGTVWVAGGCAHCGNNFVGRQGSVYCSNRCSSNASWKRRYERVGAFYISQEERLAIYERDGWVCQLCMAPVDKALPTQHRMGATLDHIECQSWALIPDHSPGNLRLAHRLCNSLRGNDPEWEWYADAATETSGAA